LFRVGLLLRFRLTTLTINIAVTSLPLR